MKKNKLRYTPLSNVLFMLKTLCEGSRVYVVFSFIKKFCEDVFWTIFSVYLTEA